MVNKGILINVNTGQLGGLLLGILLELKRFGLLITTWKEEKNKQRKTCPLSINHKLLTISKRKPFKRAL